MSQHEMQRVVVLGGGIGGQVAATRLKQKLGDRARVTLVERSGTFVFAPSLLWLMVGKRKPGSITRVQDEVDGLWEPASLLHAAGCYGRPARFRLSAATRSELRARAASRRSICSCTFSG